MSQNPPILEALAAAYSGSASGRSAGDRDYLIDYEKLLRRANLHDGDARENAERDLASAEQQSAGALVIDRDSRSGQKIRVRLIAAVGEDYLFRHIGRPSPSAQRNELAQFFKESKLITVSTYQTELQTWLDGLANASLTGSSIQPFTRDHLESNTQLINAISGVLNWKSESLIRYASVRLTENSKTLEVLRPRILTSLRAITGSDETSLESFGILEVPRSVNLHGPLTLNLPSGRLDLSLLDGPFRLSAADIARASFETNTPIILTVENESVFLELTRRNPGVLLIQTSYPGSATLQLLAKLPADVPSYHFGDTDPAGFDILRDLRSRSGRMFEPFLMDYAPCGEPLSRQESRVLKMLISSVDLTDVRLTLEKMEEHQLKGVFEQESVEIECVVSELQNTMLL